MKFKNLHHLAYYLYWLIIFIVSKAVFLIYHHAKANPLTPGEILKVFMHGLYMDASFSAYICVLPFFLFFINSIYKKIEVNKIIIVYTLLLILLITFLTIADLELYNAWGFRLDSTPLQYLNSPAEMFASVSSSPVVLLVIIFILLNVFFTWLYFAAFKKYILVGSTRENITEIIISLFLFLFLIVP
ncbi:MAG: hypothetical protein ABIN97_17100, partial [Ginsengibacter sp.]